MVMEIKYDEGCIDDWYVIWSKHDRIIFISIKDNAKFSDMTSNETEREHKIIMRNCQNQKGIFFE